MYKKLSLVIFILLIPFTFAEPTSPKKVITNRKIYDRFINFSLKTV